MSRHNSLYDCGSRRLLRALMVALVLVVTARAVGASEPACETLTTCDACIQQTTSCGWCTRKSEPLVGAACESVSTTTCASGDLINPRSSIVDSRTESSVISLTHANVFLRINEPFAVPVDVVPGPLPLDLLIVEDLSGSMGDDVATLRALAANIVSEVRTNLQADSNFGVAGFIEKAQMPVAHIRDCQADDPAANRDCWNYPYEPWLTLTSDETAFQNALNTLANHGNSDWPEDALEGTLHGAVCASSGWRPNARHMMLISTDADFHMAGDGGLTGSYMPHMGGCETVYDQMNLYPGQGQDYPSVSQVRAALLEKNIVPLFAVTVGGGSTLRNIDAYQDMVDTMGFGFVTELASDSSNIISAITEAFNKASETIQIVPAIDALGWVASVDPAAGYTDALIGGTYSFAINLLADDVNAHQLISLTAFGFGDIYINATTNYVCDCSGVLCPVGSGPGACSSVGTCDCGRCTCPANVTGDACDCDPSAPCDPPCVNGLCECGNCVCYSGWAGLTCNCSSLPCPGNTETVDCSGHGTCNCGECECDAGFTGIDCACGNGTCPGGGVNSTCSGNGICNEQTCGRCVCLAGWEGEFCNCSTIPCPGLCSGHGECNCGECECDTDYTGIDCSCHEVTCPIDPTSGIECGEGTCDCGTCDCSSTAFEGVACNCSTTPCPSSVPSVACSGHGTCECGTCECEHPWTGPACDCDSSAECPTGVVGFECSGHGTCECGECVCEGLYTHRNETIRDCSCSGAPCPANCNPPNGVCDCGVCACVHPWIGDACDCNSTFVCPNDCSGHGTCDQCGTESCECDDGFVGDDCSCSTAPCADSCQGTCVCGVCECPPGYTGIDCDCNEQSGCTDDVTCSGHGTCDGCGGCECAIGYTGINCDICIPTADNPCVVPCQGTTCGTCLIEEGCAWCPSLGSCHLNTTEGRSECDTGSLISLCTTGAAPKQTILESDGVLYGGISAGVVLFFAILAMLIYKFIIWRQDKRLWEIYNQDKDLGVAENPLYHEAFGAVDNPLYDPDAETAGEPQI